MKRLILLRHAKSDWGAKSDQGDAPMHDRDRPLNARGRQDAPRMAAYMARRHYRPDLVLCSPARRTRETLAALESALGDPPVDFAEDMYLAETAQLYSLIMAAPAAVATLLVIGHNPGIGLLATARTDFATLDDATMVGRFPTAAMAVLESAADSWQGAMSQRLRLADFKTPLMLK